MASRCALRASWLSQWPALGTHYALELAGVQISGGTCTACLALWKSVNGSLSVLATRAIGCKDGMELRVIVRSNCIFVLQDELEAHAGLMFVCDPSPITTGQPGVGVHSVPAGSIRSTRRVPERAPGVSMKKPKHAEDGTEVVRKGMSAEDRLASGRPTGLEVPGRHVPVNLNRGGSLAPFTNTHDRVEFSAASRGVRSPRMLYAQARRMFRAGSTDGDHRAALELFKSAAALGHVKAHVWLGAAYDYGLGMRPNRRLALRHYETAANAGDANAQYHMGVFYHEGIAVRRNYRKAVTWLRKAAAQNDAEALYLLGQCLRYGRGVRKNPHKGFLLLLEAAKRGVLEAQFSVGVCLSRGEGTTADARAAFRWYLTAAKRGHKDAAHNLGHLYETGRGVQVNKRRSEFWYSRAEQ